MKKYPLVFLYGLCVLGLAAQTDDKALDAKALLVRKNGFKNPEDLANALCKNLHTEREKARVLFTWLAHNMRYNYAETPRITQAVSQAAFENQRIQKAYRSGKGICMDYALLYQKMAQTVGLECEYVRGHSKSTLHGGWNKHAWNAVKLDGKWALIDPTWGSGYSESPQKFTQIFQPGYFDTAPRVFALDHFPEEPTWQLLENPLSQKQFQAQSNFAYGDLLHGIQDVSPFVISLPKNEAGQVILRLRIPFPPPVIILQTGARSIPFERQDQDGWVTLQWKYERGAKVEVWGGEKRKNEVNTQLMGVFSVE